MRLNYALYCILAASLSLTVVTTTGCGTESKESGSKKEKKSKKDKKSKKSSAKSDSKGDAEDDDSDSMPSEGKAADLNGKSIEENMKDSGSEMTLPSPGSMFVALKALGKPDWKGVVKPIKTVEFDSENRKAIVAGFLIADFFAEIQAKNKDAASATIDKLTESATALGVKLPNDLVKDLRSKVKSKKWKQVPGAVTALNTELRYQLLEEKKRPDLAQLIAVGAYVEGAWIGTKIISDDYSKKTAVILHQDELIAEIKTTKKLIKSDDYSDAIYDKMSSIKKLMKVKGDDVISKDNVKEIHSVIDGIRTKVLG